MLKAALAAGVNVRTETPVKEMIVENGKVVGVVVEAGGNSLLYFRARDIDRAYETYKSRGVQVKQPPQVIARHKQDLALPQESL